MSNETRRSGRVSRCQHLPPRDKLKSTGLIVCIRAGVVAGLVVLAAALQAQQPKTAETPVPQASGPMTPGYAPPIVVYRIDLIPTGSTFAMSEPKLEGDVYVFRTLPERTIARLPKARVKGIYRRTTDFDKEFVYQIDLVASKSYLIREEPVKKGKNYILYTWKQGTLVSVPQADVLKITRLTGMAAFKAEQLELGLTVLEGESTTAGFKETQDTSPAPGEAPAPGSTPNPGNWVYQGTPGATDAYGPGNATVARPGDTPMAPTPR